jgi:hypothetical protein
MGIAGVAVVVFVLLLFLSKPGTKPAPTEETLVAEPIETATAPAPRVDPPEPESPRPVRRNRKARQPVITDPEPEPPPLQAVFTIKDTQPPRLKVISPVSPVYLMTDTVTIRARSEVGARVMVEGRPFLETAAGVYIAKVNLLPGLNQLVVSASDAVGNTSRVSLMITYVDPSRIHRIKDNLMSMLNQLEEIKQSADEVDSRTEEIINAIADTQDADKVNQLSKDLREIREAKRSLQREIEKAFREINELLSKH